MRIAQALRRFRVSSKTPVISMCLPRVRSSIKQQNTVLRTALRGGTGTVLPGGARVYRLNWKAIPDGDYQVTVEFEFEGNRVSEQKVLSVKGGQRV